MGQAPSSSQLKTNTIHNFKPESQNTHFTSQNENGTIFVGLSPNRELTNITIPTHRPLRISIEGNIGAGKSTFLEYFNDIEAVETYPEPINWWRNLNGHNLLDLLYTDIKEWLKVFQSYVQLTRLKIQTTKPKDSTKVQIFERSLQNNRYCFIEQAYSNGCLNEVDYMVLCEWYKLMSNIADINLDLIIYLRSSPETVFERIKARNRPEESNMSLEYLKELHASHEEWLIGNKQKYNKPPVLVLDADKTLDEIFNEYKKSEQRILGNSRNRMLLNQQNTTSVRKVLQL